MKQPRQDIRNIAIIAHVDHGKTTLVDGMLHQTNVFRSNQKVEERVLDSNDLERERGITILAKNTSIRYKDVTINLIDTPGHADFGGEVERVVNMADGALLLVDAVEGPMPQTRFVLRQALSKGLKVILVVNKIDREAARPDYVLDAAFDLFIDLGASEEQADFPVVYAIALEGTAGFDPAELTSDLTPLLDTIVEHVPPPVVDMEGDTQMLVTTLEYSNYVGKIAVGRLSSGTIKSGQQIMHITAEGEQKLGKVTNLYTYQNLKREPTELVQAGDIVAVAGLSDAGIGDTLADPENPVALPPITVEEPTVRMTFAVNDSPFAGQEGKYVTSRQIRERLTQELESNVALKVEDTDNAAEFIVSGRGELHLAILIETMRREGYEFAISKPEVIFKRTDQGVMEPVEEVFIDVHTDYFGGVSELLGKRKGQMVNLKYKDDGMVYAEFHVPTRGLLGFRQPFLTTTRGTGIINTLFHGFAPHLGEINYMQRGSLVAQEAGKVSAYALQNLTQRGEFFIKPGDEVYSGQVVGEHIRDEELVINVCKTKTLTKVRSGPTAIAESLSPPRHMTLDDAIEYLHDDELLEVTPDSLRIRKKLRDHNVRMKIIKRAKKDNK